MDFKDIIRETSSNQGNSLELRASRAGIRLIDESDSTWQTMNELQQGGAKRAQESFLLGYENHRLAPIHYQGKVLDFGCGTGGSTYFLTRNGSEVTAVDNSPNIDELKRLDLKNVNVIKGDGIDLMKETPNNTYDMVTAFMFGPDDKGDFIDSFYIQANRIIKPNGRILITSDGNTLSILDSKYSGNYGSKIYQSNIFIGRKNPEI